MHILLRVLLPVLSLFLLPARPAAAQPQDIPWTDADRVVACPAHAGDAAPPDFSAPDCRRTTFFAVDPQGASLWLKASITLPAAALDPAASPLGLFVSGKAASTAWVNGHRIGGNGQPGLDAAGETPGRMDAVLPLPREVLRAGANDIVLMLSGHHGFLHLDTALHGLAVGAYADPADGLLRQYWPSLVTGGVFLLGLLYYGVAALRGRDRTGALVLSLMSLFALGQLLAESARGLWAYPYPLHDLRLVMIVLCALGFGLCLTAHMVRRFRPAHPARVFGLVALVTVVAVALVGSYDGKAGIAMFIPVVLSAIGTGRRAWRREPGALAYCVSLVVFAALALLLGGLFLDVAFFYFVAALLLFLFAQQASVLARERELRIALAGRTQQLQAALEQAQERSQQAAQPRKLRIVDTGRIELVPVDRITHCSAAGDYVELNFADGGKRLHSGSLGELEAELPPAFLRVHRSHIVNTAFVESLQRDPSGVGRLRVASGAFVPVSRRILPTVRRAIGSAETAAGQ